MKMRNKKQIRLSTYSYSLCYQLVNKCIQAGLIKSTLERPEDIASTFAEWFNEQLDVEGSIYIREDIDFNEQWHKSFQELPN